MSVLLGSTCASVLLEIAWPLCRLIYAQQQQQQRQQQQIIIIIIIYLSSCVFCSEITIRINEALTQLLMLRFINRVTFKQLIIRLNETYR